MTKKSKKSRKPKKKKLPRVHESRGTLLDIDKDRIPVFEFYKKVVGITLPDQYFTCEGSWKTKDRKFFFDNFQAEYRVRRATMDERTIPFEIARLTGQPIFEPEHPENPFFKYMLVYNLSPGCRLKVSVDSLERKPADVVILSGIQVLPFMSASPVFNQLQIYIDRTRNCWSESLHRKEEAQKAHEDSPGTG